MCRILLVKSKDKIKPAYYLNKFADMCEKSKAPDGDWQGDGWGIAWLNSNNTWEIYKSTNPIWGDRNQFEKIPATTIFNVHARSATFKTQMAEGDTSFNQPYFDENFSFVFNGHLKGVKLDTPVPGKIGAEKIWNILKVALTNQKPETALQNTAELLAKASSEIPAMNIGLASKTNIYGFCNYIPNNILPDYHVMRFIDESDVKIICSQELEIGVEFNKFENGQILTL